MISFSNILKKILLERVTFQSMYNRSEKGRKDRARTDVNVKPMRVMTLDQNEAWSFSYKSTPSTTGHRWHGYVQFYKKNVSEETNAAQLECMVDCDCPDYRYRYAYNNAHADAGRIGKHPDWPYGNESNGRKWKPRSQGGVGDYGVGMCKHLLALGEFLKTKLAPETPEPKPNKYDAWKPEPKVKKVDTTPPAQKPQTTDAPDPDDDTYTDSRTGSDTMTEEVQRGVLYERMEKFVKENPEFTVMYEDDTD
jgi:hypothetical protein